MQLVNFVICSKSRALECALNGLLYAACLNYIVLPCNSILGYNDAQVGRVLVVIIFKLTEWMLEKGNYLRVFRCIQTFNRCFIVVNVSFYSFKFYKLCIFVV